MGTADLIDAPRVPTDLAPLVEDAARHFREILATREIGLTVKLDRGAVVRTAAGMMEIVLQNVLENAISFSSAGKSIAVSLRVFPDAVELIVEDEGPGIDPEKIDSVFQRYFSLRPEDGIGSDRAVEHSGLGLWIVRRNVEALGGQVMAANRPGGGLSIRVRLPRAVIH